MAPTRTAPPMYAPTRIASSLAIDQMSAPNGVIATIAAMAPTVSRLPSAGPTTDVPRLARAAKKPPTNAPAAKVA